MRSSHLQKFIWNGLISKNVSLRVISDQVSCFYHQIEQFSVFLVDNSWTKCMNIGLEPGNVD